MPTSRKEAGCCPTESRGSLSVAEPGLPALGVPGSVQSPVDLDQVPDRTLGPGMPGAEVLVKVVMACQQLGLGFLRASEPKEQDAVAIAHDTPRDRLAGQAVGPALEELLERGQGPL